MIRGALRRAPFDQYNVWWSLEDKKYAGTAMLIKASTPPARVRHRLDDQAGHDKDGRVILVRPCRRPGSFLGTDGLFLLDRGSGSRLCVRVSRPADSKVGGFFCLLRGCFRLVRRKTQHLVAGWTRRRVDVHQSMEHQPICHRNLGF